MTLRVCLSCTTAFAVGLRRCPQCGSTEHVEQGDAEGMPKINSGPQGATDKTDPDLTVAEQIAVNRGEDLEQFRKDNPDLTKDSDNEEGDNSLAGNSSSTSGESQKTNTEKSNPEGQKPALTTDNLSKKDREGNSTAGSTDGSGKASSFQIPEKKTGNK